MVVGWPAADWTLLEPLLLAGELPHLAGLLDEGCFVSLATPPPHSHAAAWTTLATGMMADRHGVLADAENRPDGGGVQAAGRRSWRAPAFWEVLEGAGFSTICVGWPATAPAGRWPGIHIDERFAQATGSDFEAWAVPPDAVAPATLSGTLRDLRIHPADGLHSQLAALLPEVSAIDPRLDQRPLLLEAALAQVGTIHAVATHLAEGSWDVLCVCHDLLRLIATGQAVGDAAAETPYGRLLARAYGFQDMMLGRLMELAGPGTAVMVASAAGTAAGILAPVGIVVAGGAGIGRGASPGAALTDLAPSILARFGLRCDAEGKPIAALVPPHKELIHAGSRPIEPPRPATALMDGDMPDILDAAQVSALEQCTAERALNLAEVQLARGSARQAAATLEALRETQPGNILAMQRLVECQALRGDAQACLPLAKALLEADPQGAWGHLAMAASCVLTQDHAGAQTHMEAANQLGAGDIRVQLRLGGLHLLRGRPGEAAQSFETILALAPGRAEALYGLGVALAAQGHAAAAEEALRQSIAGENVQPLTYLQLAAVLSAQARWQESISLLMALRDQHPGLPGADAVLAEAQQGAAQQMAFAALAARR